MKLKTFLYLLMRDELTPGRVETLITQAERAEHANNTTFSNSYLAAYAQQIALRLAP